jgi:phosphoglycolate phosphatase
MSADLRLILFDVDGTLVDSQAHIVASMTRAFQGVGAEAPSRAATLSIVGLSLPIAVAELAPDMTAQDQAAIVEGYKQAYMQIRAEQGSAQSSPFYPHARMVLDQLAAVDHYLLGIATGKSRRGLDALLAGHGLERMFLTQQVADHHPSKPHPAMIEAALGEMGLTADNAVMIGDTVFDMEMARAAGARAIAVDWGYHDVARLAPLADQVVSDFRDLPAAIHKIWES